MNRCARIVGISGALVALFATCSPGLRAGQVDRPSSEGQAVASELNGNTSAITYWVSELDGWHVVTTVDTVIAENSDAERHAVVRFEAVLLPGQSQAISVPFPIGEQPRILRIRRLGNKLQVMCIPGLREASEAK
jgi:hypothetical protein